jgi:hypothetical protein
VLIPWKDLNLSPGDLADVAPDPLEMIVVAAEGNVDIDLAPSLAPKIVFDDLTNMVYVTFMCDVSGKKVPIDLFTAIATPPPPEGEGIVYITGNQDSLAMWIANKIPLVDNGTSGDEKTEDQIWASTFGFAPGTMLRYKYTIGLPKDEASWSGTEEFPLTERGFDVTQNPKFRRMVVRDIFADRPQPTGTLGPGTVLECYEDADDTTPEKCL